MNNDIIDSDTKIGKIYFDQRGLLFNLGIYSYYPLLFKPLFNCKEHTNNICLFSRYYTGWLFILDKLYDNINEYKPEEMLMMSTILSEAEHILGNILPLGDENFYEQIRIFRNINDRTMLKERNHFSYEKHFEDSELFDYCRDKYVIAKMIVYLCYVTDESKNENILNALYISHDCYSIGRQLLDELDDYKEDYEINKFNIYAYKLMKKYGKLVDEDLVKSELLNVAKKYYYEAIKAVQDLPDCGWKRFLTISAKKLNT